MPTLFDTYAWVELFKHSAAGERVAELMQEENVFTAIPSLSELAEWALKNKLDTGETIGKVRKTSAVVPLSEEVSELAGRLNHEIKKETRGWGMMDSMIYATALTQGLKVVTGDRHFENKPGVVMI